MIEPMPRHPKLGPTGLDAQVPTEVVDLQSESRKFAREVMRPVAAELDKMSADDVVRPGSPLHDFLAEVKRTGLADLGALVQLPPEEQALMMPVLMEELGWGDAGLATLSIVRDVAKFTAFRLNSAELIERVGDGLGCFIGTQPDRGSDAIDHLGLETYPGMRPTVGNLTVRREGADYVVHGQSSQWISGAPVASCGILQAACDFGDGFYDLEGRLNYIGLMVPLDEPGVSKSPPLSKIGQRSLPQGAIYFDSVRVPAEFVVAEGIDAHRDLATNLALAKTIVATAFVGVGRAAFDYAFAYTHERSQGGVPLIRHQSVRARIFQMWNRLEASRALVRRAVAYHYGPYGPSAIGSITAKVHATEASFALCQEAMRLFGANGLTPEYPVEKLLRDSQSSLIEDGENTILGINVVAMLARPDSADV